ncbi:MAG TPA: hypothetical protein VMG40_18750 [Bryobacteraceae bacterium]|nr:hypothetical protein [Bryobacteraceae bacterium]
MFKTAVGLFGDAHRVDDVIREIEALGFPRNEVKSLKEPATFEVTGVMSFARLDFETDLRRELARIGATKTEIEAYIDGLRHGGTLVFATSSDGDERVDAAARVMNQHGAVEIEEMATTGPEPRLPRVVHAGMTPSDQGPVLAGRIRQPRGRAGMFVW